MADERFEQITARHVHVSGRDPYKVLGVKPQRRLCRRSASATGCLSRENHPDRLVARGVPAEFHQIANDRMAALNAAYEAIEKERRAA